jgi:hypothetical protein
MKMVEVFYYIPVEETDNVVECGLRLSRWFDKEVVIEGEMRKCVSALLNPRDDIEKYRSNRYKCVKLELSPGNCYIADKYLYRLGRSCPDIMDIYCGSIIPIENYIFGSYRLPECLVTGTVIAGQISVLGKGLDTPILFDSSEQLYMNNLMEACKEGYEDFNDCLLYYFYCKLAQIGKVDKIEDSESRVALFFDKKSGKVTTIRVPEIEKDQV